MALDLNVLGRVAGLDDASFKELARTAKEQSLLSAGARPDLSGELTA